MKNLILILSFILFGWNDIISSETINLKVMAWNIWHGGKGESLPVDDGRSEIIEIIKHSEADVVLMIETYGSAPFIAEGLGFHYTLLSDNLCIFSRFPIQQTFLFPDSISPFHFGGAEIFIQGKIPVVFFDTWLHYLPDARDVPLNETSEKIIAWEREGTRDDEIKIILKTIEPFLKNSDNIPVIMGGDFNSHSHLDWTEETKDIYHHGGAVVDWPVSKSICAVGLIDSYREIFPYPAVNIGVTWLSGKNFNGESQYSRQDRIDYLYYKGSKIQAVDSETVNAPDGKRFYYRGKNFMFPSDHGFIVTDFRIDL